MSFKRGDVLIALFPHADGSPPKPRPVLVVQADGYNAKIKNLVVAAITSNLRHASDPTSFLINVSTADGKASGLVQNSVISCINLATIEDTLVAKKIGQSPAL
jgi:mRNA interferase MazF